MDFLAPRSLFIAGLIGPVGQMVIGKSLKISGTSTFASGRRIISNMSKVCFLKYFRHSSKPSDQFLNGIIMEKILAYSVVFKRGQNNKTHFFEQAFMSKICII